MLGNSASLQVSAPGKYKVVATGSDCSAVTSNTVDIVEATISVMSVVSGPTSFCAAGQEASYSINLVSEATSYTWSVPAGWVILSGQGTASILVRVGSTGSVSVAAANQCGPGATAVLEVNVQQPIAAPAVLGNKVCAGESAFLQISNPQQHLTYTWYSSNTSSTPLATGTTFNAPPLLGTTTYYVAATNTASGCASARTAFTADVTPAISNNLITENQSLCLGQLPAPLTSGLPTGGEGIYNYQWQTSTDGQQFMPVPGANTVNFNPGPLQQTTWFRRVVTSGSCQSVSNSVKVTVYPVPTRPTISFSDSTLTASITEASYEWLKDGLALQPTTQRITVKESGYYQVRVKNVAGCASAVSDSLYIELQPVSDDQDAPVSFYPNPSLDSKITLTVKQPLHNVHLSVLNTSGTAMYSTKLQKWKDALKVNLEHLPQGLYFVYIVSDELRSTQRLMLRH